MSLRSRWDIDWRSEELAAEAKATGERALKDAGQEIIDDAAGDAPRQTGAMVRSRNVDVKFPIAYLTFGQAGPSREYTILQHANENYEHPDGGGPFFLGKQFRSPEKFLDIVARKFRNLLKGD